jgi:SagB-type dehydrogenase family enzyme
VVDLAGSFTFRNAHERNRAFTLPTQSLPVTWFKRLPGAPVIPLPSMLPLRFDRSADSSDTLTRIATLCHYTLGILRRDVDSSYPYHRGVPSARCFYPSELYLWMPKSEAPLRRALPAGLYHYAPVEHVLEQVRDGVSTAWVAAALSRPASGIDCALILTADFWRIAHLYGEFALRLCALEAGHGVANLAEVGRAFGWQPTVAGFFADEALAATLGIDQEAEGIMATVLLSTRGASTLSLRHEPVAEVVPPLLHAWQHSTGVPQADSCAGLRQMQRAAAKVGAPLARGAVRAPAPGARPSGVTEVALPPPAVWQHDLRTRILRRQSGAEHEGLMGRPTPIELSVLSRILYEVGSTFASPGSGSNQPSSTPAEPALALETDFHHLLATYLVVAPIHVNGLATGFYRYRPETHSLTLLADGPDVAHLITHKLIHSKGINSASLSFHLYMVTSTDEIFAAAGARAYRLMHLWAGALAQRAGLAAADFDLFCRPNLTFLTTEFERALGLSGLDQTVINQVIVGRNQFRGWRYDLSL